MGVRQASQGALVVDEDRTRALTDQVGKLYADIEELTEANQQLQVRVFPNLNPLTLHHGPFALDASSCRLVC